MYIYNICVFYYWYLTGIVNMYRVVQFYFQLIRIEKVRLISYNLNRLQTNRSAVEFLNSRII